MTAECRAAPVGGIIRRAPSLVQDGEIVIDGEIQPYGPVNLEQVRRGLGDLDGNDRIAMRFTAGLGGNIDESMRIYLLLRDHPKPIVAHVERACSADTIILMAASEITIAQSGTLMVHSPRRSFGGDMTAQAMRLEADNLDGTQERMVDIYARRTGRGRADLHLLLGVETWMTADRAVELGFADKVVPNPGGDDCPLLRCPCRR